MRAALEQAFLRVLRPFAGGFPQIRQAYRKHAIIRRHLTVGKLANLARLSIAFLAKRDTVGGAVPFHLKVDVTPRCQLRCPVCLHGSLAKSERSRLPDAMTLDVFRELVEQVRGRTHVMSLYNLGEPLLNKDLVPMIRLAKSANINTYITTNLSLPLSDEKLSDLLQSGLTCLIVAVDGISPETFGQQRVGGDWTLIERNLRRLAALRGPADIQLMLQYIVFDHNRKELPRVRGFCRELGLDLVTVDGLAIPWVQQFRPRTGWNPRAPKRLPRCGWPYFSALVTAEGKIYGCCNYRMDEVNDRTKNGRPLGSIREMPLSEIYGSEPYRQARRLTVDPGKHGPIEDHFCHGCVALQR